MNFGKILLICAAFLLMLCGCSESEPNHPMLKKAQQSKRLGEYRNAELCYKKYLQTHPDTATVHLSLAQLYDEELEDYLLAIYHYKEYLRCAGDSANVREINNFIERCEQKFMKKGRAKQAHIMTDEEEIARMTEAYKKRLVIEQQEREAELIRLREESQAELEKENEAAAAVETANVQEADVKQSAVVETAAAGNASAAVSDSPIEKIPAASAETKVEIANAENTVEKEKVSTTAPDIEKNTVESADSKKLPQMEDMSSAVVQRVETAAPRQNSVIEYKIQRGDTFTHLSRKFYGTTKYYKQLMEYNKISNPNKLRIGKSIKIPPLEVLKGDKK